MYWVLLDIAIGVLAVVVLGLTGLALYRHVRTLLRAMGAASAKIGDATPGPVGVQRR